MDKETYEALKLLYMNSIKPIDVDYSEQWKLIGGWIDEVSKDYECNCGSSELPVWHSKSDCLNPY